MVEGFKRYPHPKLEIHRQKVGKPLIAAEDETVVAIATAKKVIPPIDIPLLDIDNVMLITEFVIGHLGFDKRGRRGTA